MSILGRLAFSHPSNVFMCREGRRNTEKHGKSLNVELEEKV
jgi:hypothetical protein